MATMLMRISAPMQSWGTSSNFTERDSAREPSKSGIIGLICAAMGRARDADISDLNCLRMGVRVDREGSLEKDFQTARNILTADKSKTDASIISNRYYLANAVFLVGLEGDKQVLESIQQALKSPKWSLFLGRKAFPPAQPVYLENGLREGALLDELTSYELLIGDGMEKKRVILEVEEGEFRRHDNPIDFGQRRFSHRYVKIVEKECGKGAEV